MEKNQFDLVINVLKRFEEYDLLDSFMLIGSWCVPFYDEYFNGLEGTGITRLKTRDIDFLISKPKVDQQAINIPNILSDLGFTVDFRGSEGYIKLIHPELTLEFLTPEKGRGTDRPVEFPQLGVNAVALRMLNFLTMETLKVRYKDITITVPHPAVFALHKLIVSERRRKEDKSLKDRTMAIGILNALIDKGEVKKIKSIIAGIHKGWANKIKSALESHKEEDLTQKIF